MNGVFTGYYLDGGQILEEKGTNGTVQYTWGNGLIRRGSEYPLTDGQGSTNLETNSSQAVTSTQETEAFGRSIGGTGATANPFGGYHGSEGYRQDGDGPQGLEPYQKVGARYYDATFGRFITRDTDLSQAAYAYCNGDPVNFSDPSGHSKLSDWLKKLLQNLSAVSGTITKSVTGGIAAYSAGVKGSQLLDSYNNQRINNQGLANEKTMLNNYLNSHPDADMTQQLNLYNYMRDGTFKADAGFAAQAGDQYLHGLSGVR